jgi:fused signal recognition particle receptor
MSFLKNLFTASELDDDFYDELEETLILSDVGFEATEDLLDDLKRLAKERKVKKASDCRELLKESMKRILETSPAEYPYETEKTLILVVGVNGVGKTTSIGKLSYQLKKMGRKVLLVAADTFRAGAVEQLKEWAARTRTEIITQQEGADPAAVLYDGISAARARGSEVVFCDTAGRLQNKKNLMEELKKMHRIIGREAGSYRTWTLLVVDATTGQNALNQAREFSAATDVNGLILTKLDGTAKGGIALAIKKELGIPIAYVGVGEKVPDLRKFDADAYIDRLLGTDTEED